jgi:hypothetical protein
MREIVERHITEVRKQLKRIERGLDGFKTIQSTVGTAKLLHVLTDVHLKLVRVMDTLEKDRDALGPYISTPVP